MAPYKSESQRRLFKKLLKKGKIKKETIEEFDKASKGKKLPETVSEYKDIVHRDRPYKNPKG